MKNNKTKFYAICVIVLLVYSLLAFVIPFEKNLSFWNAYLFGVIAIALQIYVFNIAFLKGTNARSKFYGCPIAKVGLTYLPIQLALSFAEMAFAGRAHAWEYCVIDAVILAIVAIGLITADAIRDEIVRQDEETARSVETMRTLRSLAASIVAISEDRTIKEAVKKVCEDLKYSDPITSEKTQSIEAEMEALLKELQQAVVDGDQNASLTMCNQISDMLVERNRLCKLSKAEKY